MSDSKDDEAKFNETLKRMLDTKPKPHARRNRSQPPLGGGLLSQDQQ
jgi:hypothetical protein